MEDVDYSLVADSLIKQLFPKNNEGKNESVIFISKAKKFNRYGIAQDRICILSSMGIYLVTNAKCHTRCLLSDLKWIVKARMSKEFVLCFTNNVDLRLTIEDREDLLQLVGLRFANLCPNQGLKVFGVPSANLKEFRNTSAGFEAEPEDKYLMKDESIISA